MVLGKKSQTFTIIAIILSAVIISWFMLSNYSFPKMQKAEQVKYRVMTMNSFYKDILSDFDRAAYISAYRTVLSMEDIIIRNGSYISQFDKSFEEIMVNGTYFGENVSLIFNSTLNAWQEKIKRRANQVGIITNISFSNVEVRHYDPWTVNISLDIEMRLTDIANTAVWQKREKKSTMVSIIGFEDPLYAIGTLGRIANIVSKTPYEGRYIIGNNTNNLMEHVLNGYYAESKSAPNFIMRLQGNLNSSEYGIESLVNLDRLAANDIPTSTKTCVDYIYFSTQNPPYWNVQGMPSWFRLDNMSVDGKTHLEKYQVEGLI